MSRADECGLGLFVVDGACLSPREIDAYCGSRSVESACVAAECASGEGVDSRASTCVPQRTVREIVARDRPTPMFDGSTVACREDRVLVAHGDHAVCLARSDACPRATHSDPSRPRCVPDAPCPAGAVRANTCVRVVSAGVLDVGAWSRSVLGADGGGGDDRLCRSLAQAPWEVDIGPGGERTVALTVQLTFPDNDVSQATATASAELPSAGLRAVQAGLDSLLVPLRALSRMARATDAASATVHVSCTVRGGSSPLVQAP